MNLFDEKKVSEARQKNESEIDQKLTTIVREKKQFSGKMRLYDFRQNCNGNKGKKRDFV